MFKKIFIISTICFTALINSPIFAGNQDAKLQIINKTQVPQGWLSVALFEAAGYRFSLCSEGFCAETSKTVTIPALQAQQVTFIDFRFGNSRLSPKLINENCRNITITAAPGETKVITIYPKAAIDWTTSIHCEVSSATDLS